MCGAHRATAPTTNSSRSDAGAQCHHNATSPPSTTDCWKTRDGDGTLTHGAPQRRDVGTRKMPARPDWPPGGYRPALRGTCPDADDASVEAAEATVNNLKASEFKPGRIQARKGGDPDTGRPVVAAAEIRRCRRTTEICQSRRSPITPCFWEIRGPGRTTARRQWASRSGRR